MKGNKSKFVFLFFFLLISKTSSGWGKISQALVWFILFSDTLSH